MNKLRIVLFGGGRVEFAESQKYEALTTTTCALLAFLVFYRQRTHPREVLLNLLWGELPPERARGCLNTALWRLRQRIEPFGTPSGTYLVTSSSGDVCFNCQSDFWLDVAAFEKSVESALAVSHDQTDNQAAQLEQAISLYTGDLLENSYCDWVLPERERLRNLCLDAHEYLMHHYHTRLNFHRALDHGAQILAFNPLREDIHRQMMRIYVDNGQRSLAVRQYQICQQVLHTELNIEPMLETRLLLEQVSGSSLISEKFPISDQVTSEVKQAMERLQLALDVVNQARQDLERALNRISKT